jgi:hypothetical protein
MKKSLLILGAASMALTSVALADTVVMDFEAGTAGTNLPSNWLATFSGTTNGAANAVAQYSNEQAHGGSLSGKLAWDWTGASGGIVRIQPAAAGWPSGTNLNVDHTSEPYIGFAIYASGSGDGMAFYMGEGAAGNGASPYERFVGDYYLNFNGWRVVERNILTDPVVGWVNGNGSLNATCSISGFFFYQGAPAGTVTYYIDDVSFTASTRNPDLLPHNASVSDWSVY